MTENINKPVKKKPFITITEVLIAIFVLFLTAVAFEKIEIGPPVPTRNVLEAEIKQFNKQIVPIPISKIANTIEAGDGRPTLIVLYASWCGYCKKLLPMIANLKNEGKLDIFHLLVISLDEDARSLSRYLLRHYYDGLFTPYIFEENGVKGFSNLMILKGLNYQGEIPFTVAFDNKGKVLSTISGVPQKSYFYNFIEEASANLR